jgi:predicted naringenin-chalcone synthase
MALVEELGLPRSTERTHIGFMGCHGALNAIRVAAALTREDPGAVPLVCAVELCTLHFAYGWDPDMLVANALFSDGAAALVGRSQGGPGGWRVAATGTFLMPDSEDAMTWRIGDHGFRMTLSARVPELIERHLHAWMCGWLHHNGLRIGDIRSWAVHPGGPRILDSVSRALELDEGATLHSREVLKTCGNMSSATVAFIIDAIRSGGEAAPCVALAFGPGLAVEATLFLPDEPEGMP